MYLLSTMVVAALMFFGCDGSTDISKSAPDTPKVEDAGVSDPENPYLDLGRSLAPDANVPPSDASTPSADEQAPNEDTSQGVITYVFSWDRTGIEFSPRGDWSVTNDLGYTVVVQSGYLITYQASLVPCDEMGQHLPVKPWYERILSFIVPTAQAGHGALDDPSALQLSFAESLTTLATTTKVVQIETPTRYCDLHYLVSQADFSTENLPMQPELDSLSLVLKGYWSHEDHGAMNEFDISIDIAYGVLQSSASAVRPLKSNPVTTGPGHDALEVRIARHLATAFDGIEFDAFIPRAIGRRIMRNLVTKATLGTDR